MHWANVDSPAACVAWPLQVSRPARCSAPWMTRGLSRAPVPAPSHGRLTAAPCSLQPCPTNQAVRPCLPLSQAGPKLFEWEVGGGPQLLLGVGKSRGWGALDSCSWVGRRQWGLDRETLGGSVLLWAHTVPRMSRLMAGWWWCGHQRPHWCELAGNWQMPKEWTGLRPRGLRALAMPLFVHKDLLPAPAQSVAPCWGPACVQEQVSSGHWLPAGLCHLPPVALVAGSWSLGMVVGLALHVRWGVVLSSRSWGPGPGRAAAHVGEHGPSGECTPLR